MLTSAQLGLAGAWAELGNIQNRVAKGIGNVTKVINMLEKVTLGSHYFETAMLLRNSIVISALLTNAESWHGLTIQQVNKLESVDKLLLRKILKTPVLNHYI